MRVGRLSCALLLVTVLGLTVQLMGVETAAVSLQQTNRDAAMNDIQVLNATYPGLFDANYAYEEFASADLAAIPRPLGAFTIRDVVISYHFVYNEHGIIWNYTQGQADEKVLVLMIYPLSNAPSPHNLQLYGMTSVFVAARTSNGFAHAYLFLMQSKM